MEIKCHCGYKYYLDVDNTWKENKMKWIVEGSESDSKPIEVSHDLKLYACPECGTVYHNK